MMTDDIIFDEFNDLIEDNILREEIEEEEARIRKQPLF